MGGIVDAEMRDAGPLRKPPDLDIRPTQVRRVVLRASLLQMLPRKHLIPIISLVPVIAHTQIGAEFAGVEMADPCADGGVYDHRLVFERVVAEEEDYGGEALERGRVGVEAGNFLHAGCTEGVEEGGFGGGGGARYVVEEAEAGELGDVGD